MNIESAARSEFAGRDGFHHFYGKVVPQSAWKKENDLKSLSGQQSHRAKVRLVGYDSFDVNELADEDCRWAQFMPSAISGNGAGGLGETFCISGGETVLGYFTDPEMQNAVVLGVFPASQDEVTNTFRKTQNAFSPSYEVDLNANNRGSSYTAANPVSIHQKGGEGTVSSKISENAGTITTQSYDKCGNDVISRIAQILQDFLSFQQGLTQTAGKWLDPITNEIINMDYQLEVIQKKISGLIKGTVNNMRKKLLKNLNKKFSKLLGQVKTSAAGKDENVKKGAQKAATGIIGLISCLFGGVLGGIGALIKNMFSNLLGKVVNGALCAVEQFVSGMFAKLFDSLEGALSGVMSGLNWLVGGLSSVAGALFGASSMARGLLNFLDKCGLAKCKPSKSWTSAIAGGVIPAPPDDWGKQIKNINKLNAVSDGLSELGKRIAGGEDVSDVDVNGVPIKETLEITKGLNTASSTLNTLGLGSIESAISNSSLFGTQNSQFDACNNVVSNPNIQDDLTPTRPGFIYPKCIPPVVKVSGTGSGAELLAIVGNDRRIFSIEVINGGSGYDETTGLTVIDNTGNGKGAFARPLIKDGVIDRVVLMRTGYGYCLNTVGVGTDITAGIGTNVIGTIRDVFVEQPGYDFNPDDTISIGDVNFPIITSPDGSIADVTIPVNLTEEFSSSPQVVFNTTSGFGARLIPIMQFKGQFKTDVGADERRTKPLIGITQVIDCIGDKTGLVGYINGVPYYGPFHFHPSRGVKMVGAQHVDYPHEIIYDTMEESLGQPSVISRSSSVTGTETTETSETTSPVDTTPTIVTEQTTSTSTPTTPTTTTDTSSSSSGSSDPTPPSTPPSSPPSGGGGYGGGY